MTDSGPKSEYSSALECDTGEPNYLHRAATLMLMLTIYFEIYRPPKKKKKKGKVLHQLTVHHLQQAYSFMKSVQANSSRDEFTAFDKCPTD